MSEVCCSPMGVFPWVSIPMRSPDCFTLMVCPTDASTRNAHNMLGDVIVVERQVEIR
jgi:hypothetical protein